MAITTMERIVKMETQIDNLDKKISDHCKANDKGFVDVIVELKELRQDIKNTYATKEEVRPLRMAVYSSIGILAAALVGFVFWIFQKAIEAGVFS